MGGFRSAKWFVDDFRVDRLVKFAQTEEEGLNFYAAAKGYEKAGLISRTMKEERSAVELLKKSVKCFEKEAAALALLMGKESDATKPSPMKVAILECLDSAASNADLADDHRSRDNIGMFASRLRRTNDVSQIIELVSLLIRK